MAKIPSKNKKPSHTQERIDRRFLPASTINPFVLYGGGGIGALVLGAGVWGQFGHQYQGEEPFAQAFWLLACGAVLVGLALWFSTSGDAAVRVGAPGIAQERGSVRRIPWSGLKQISWASGEEALVISGQDEASQDFTFKVRVRSQPEAAAWILREAQARVPALVDVSDDVVAKMPKAEESAGTKLVEPLQIVGKRCSVSGKILAYEPDGRVCDRCERIYSKRRVPKVCACGNELTALRDSVDPHEEQDEAESA